MFIYCVYVSTLSDRVWVVVESLLYVSFATDEVFFICLKYIKIAKYLYVNATRMSYG